MNVHADAAQIEQVLMNLSLNAYHAMPDGGHLRIETKNAMLDEEFCKRHIGLRPGPYVELSVSDTGCGMDKNTVDRVFEPFFTTKMQGEGTGLGLAMVYGIVQVHGGRIFCHSKPGDGTTFKICLPVCEDEQDASVEVSQIRPSFGTETILIVDDEEPIRDLGGKILERAGYSVLTASNGIEAIEMYSKNQEEIALVILDFIMPEMSGKECIDELLGIDPNVKIVVASGYTIDSQTREDLLKRAKGFLEKPFRMNEVQRIVRKVLDEHEHIGEQN
jgi:CheY-like chemotaxis protein